MYAVFPVAVLFLVDHVHVQHLEIQLELQMKESIHPVYCLLSLVFD